MRSAMINRETKETKVEMHLNLDGSGEHDIATGLGFLDHMLTHIAAHGLFDLTVRAEGDLHVDAHHTVEDVASRGWRTLTRRWTRRWRSSPWISPGGPTRWWM